MTMPRVSIAIPVYNGASSIGPTLESALQQTYDDLEIVVCDNASTDGTVDIVRSYDDPRIRLHRNPANLGFLRNGNLSLELSRGEYLKPLHADDRLLPRCVERMVELLDAHPSVGLVFAPRQVELEDESDPDQREWRELYGRPERHFSGLREVNEGRELLSQYLRAGIPDNWIGEPSCLMVRRSVVERIGLFSPYVNAFNDIDMWVRVMALYDVGFIDEELSVYRRSRGSLVSELRNRDWLDRLYLLEGLAADPEMAARLPDLGPALARERKKVARELLRTARRRPEGLPARLRNLAEYGRVKLREAVGRPVALHPGMPRAGTG
jgi:glycosyltransferase involved in cell wall biosynthesis